MSAKVFDLTVDETKMLDLDLLGEPERLSGFLVLAPRPAIVDPGPTRSAEIWLSALDALNIPRDEVAYIIPTHVHLDHGGGTGTLVKELSKAQVLVHPRGAAHIVDPSRLVQGAQGVFDGKVEEYFGLPEPVDEGRVTAVDPDSKVDLGGGHVLRFIDARGHARHQYMILDEGSGALFAADEIGMRYPLLSKPGDDYILPTTAPNQFDPEAMKASNRWVRDIRPQLIGFGHFGVNTMDPALVTERVEEQVDAFTSLLDKAETVDHETMKRLLLDHVRADLESRGLAWDDQVEAIMNYDQNLNGLGLVFYWQYLQKQKEQQGT